MSDTPSTDQPEPGGEERTSEGHEKSEEEHEDQHEDLDEEEHEDLDDEDEEENNPNHEAAKWRRRLRDTESERDRLAAVVAGYQRAEAEELATAGAVALASGADLWRGGLELADVVDEEGRVDGSKVSAAVAQVLDHAPHWRRPAADLGQGVRTPTAPPTRDLASLIRDRTGDGY